MEPPDSRGLWHFPSGVSGPSPTSRWGHSTTLVVSPSIPQSPLLVVFGGWAGAESLSDIYCYEILSKKWTKPPVPGPHPPALSGHTMTSLSPTNSSILVLLGGAGGGTEDEPEREDPEPETEGEFSRNGDGNSDEESGSSSDSSRDGREGRRRVVSHSNDRMRSVWTFDVVKMVWVEIVCQSKTRSRRRKRRRRKRRRKGRGTTSKRKESTSRRRGSSSSSRNQKQKTSRRRRSRSRSSRRRRKMKSERRHQKESRSRDRRKRKRTTQPPDGANEDADPATAAAATAGEAEVAVPEPKLEREPTAESGPEPPRRRRRRRRGRRSGRRRNRPGRSETESVEPQTRETKPSDPNLSIQTVKEEKEEQREAEAETEVPVRVKVTEADEEEEGEVEEDASDSNSNSDFASDSETETDSETENESESESEDESDSDASDDATDYDDYDYEEFVFPPTRSRHTATFVPPKVRGGKGGKIYMFAGGGHLDGEARVYSDMWTLDVDRWMWERIRVVDAGGAGIAMSMSQSSSPTWGHAAVFGLQRHIFVFGGCDESKIMSGALRRFDTETNVWESLSFPADSPADSPASDGLGVGGGGGGGGGGRLTPSPRAAHSVCAYRDFMFILWGGDNESFFDDLFIVDMASLECKKLSFSKPVARCAHTATVVDDFLYVLGGGRQETQRYKELYAIDLTFALEMSGIADVVGVQNGNERIFGVVPEEIERRKRHRSVFSVLGRIDVAVGAPNRILDPPKPRSIRRRAAAARRGERYRRMSNAEPVSPPLPVVAAAAASRRRAHRRQQQQQQQYAESEEIVLPARRQQHAVVPVRAPTALVVQQQETKLRQATASDLPISSWLESLKLKRYTRHFVSHEIDMESLVHLTEDDLESIGISKIGPKKKLLFEIHKMRRALTARDDALEALVHRMNEVSDVLKKLTKVVMALQAQAAQHQATPPPTPPAPAAAYYVPFPGVGAPMVPTSSFPSYSPTHHAPPIPGMGGPFGNPRGFYPQQGNYPPSAAHAPAAGAHVRRIPSPQPTTSFPQQQQQQRRLSPSGEHDSSSRRGVGVGGERGVGDEREIVRRGGILGRDRDRDRGGRFDDRRDDVAPPPSHQDVRHQGHHAAPSRRHDRHGRGASTSHASQASFRKWRGGGGGGGVAGGGRRRRAPTTRHPVSSSLKLDEDELAFLDEGSPIDEPPGAWADINEQDEETRTRYPSHGGRDGL